jgi:O-antigen/teichoic acid export membrane protein
MSRYSRLLAILPAPWRERLASRDGTQIIFNVGWMVTDQLARLALGLVVGVWVARYLGPAQFGVLSYALALVALFSAVAALGLDNIVVRELVHQRDDEPRILGTAFVLQLAGGVVSVLLTNVTAAYLRADDPRVRFIVAVASLGSLVQAFNVIDLWFRSHVRSKYVAASRVLSVVASSVLKIVLIVAHAPLIAFAWTTTFELALGAAGLVAMHRLAGGRMSHWRASLSRTRALMHDSWPLVFSGIVTSIYMRIDQVMLGGFVDERTLGLYAAASRMAAVGNFIPMAIASSVLPSIVSARNSGSEEAFYARVQGLYNVMAAAGYALAIPVTLFAEPLVQLLFGASYHASAGLLRVMIWSALFINLGVARTSFLTAMNWTRVHFLSVFLGCVLNVGLNVVLIPLYGGMGAAVASLAAYWFAAHGFCFVYRPLFPTGRMLTRALVWPKLW